MITAICMNPCFDKTVEVDSFRPGEVNRIRSKRIDIGGKGVNVATVAHRLGLEARCIGLMGQDGAGEFCRQLDREGLQHEFFMIPGGIRYNLKIFNRESGEMTELNEPGLTVNEEMLVSFSELLHRQTADSELVVLTGSLPPGCPDGTYATLMKALEGKKVILDTEGRELESGARCAPFLIKPNLHELESTLGVELRTMRSIRDAALMFIRLGVSHAVISMGSMGAMYVSGAKTLYAPAVRVEAKSTVGAGDAMLGGMLLGYERTHDMSRAFRYGIAAGAASVMTEGTQLIVPADFERLLEQVRVQEV